MKSILAIFLFFGSLGANAWDVDCGNKTVYYSNGATMVSQGGTVYYRTGSTMISQGGTVYYATGSALKSQGNTIYYPMGSTLKSQGGTYYYDNGSTARSSSGTLYRRNGSRTDIPFDISLNLGSDVDGFVHVYGDSSADTDMDLRIEMGSGETMRIKVTTDGISCFGGSRGRIKVRGRAGTAEVLVNDGYDEDDVREAIQNALDSL